MIKAETLSRLYSLDLMLEYGKSKEILGYAYIKVYNTIPNGTLSLTQTIPHNYPDIDGAINFCIDKILEIISAEPDTDNVGSAVIKT